METEEVVPQKPSPLPDKPQVVYVSGGTGAVNRAMIYAEERDQDDDKIYETTYCLIDTNGKHARDKGAAIRDLHPEADVVVFVIGNKLGSGGDEGSAGLAYQDEDFRKAFREFLASKPFLMGICNVVLGHGTGTGIADLLMDDMCNAGIMTIGQLAQCGTDQGQLHPWQAKLVRAKIAKIDAARRTYSLADNDRLNRRGVRKEDSFAELDREQGRTTSGQLRTIFDPSRTVDAVDFIRQVYATPQDSKVGRRIRYQTATFDYKDVVYSETSLDPKSFKDANGVAISEEDQKLVAAPPELAADIWNQQLAWAILQTYKNRLYIEREDGVPNGSIICCIKWPTGFDGADHTTADRMLTRLVELPAVVAATPKADVPIPQPALQLEQSSDLSDSESARKFTKLAVYENLDKDAKAEGQKVVINLFIASQTDWVSDEDIEAYDLNIFKYPHYVFGPAKEGAKEAGASNELHLQLTEEKISQKESVARMEDQRQAVVAYLISRTAPHSEAETFPIDGYADREGGPQAWALKMLSFVKNVLPQGLLDPNTSLQARKPNAPSVIIKSTASIAELNAAINKKLMYYDEEKVKRLLHLHRTFGSELIIQELATAPKPPAKPPTKIVIDEQTQAEIERDDAIEYVDKLPSGGIPKPESKPFEFNNGIAAPVVPQS